MPSKRGIIFLNFFCSQNAQIQLSIGPGAAFHNFKALRQTNLHSTVVKASMHLLLILVSVTWSSAERYMVITERLGEGKQPAARVPRNTTEKGTKRSQTDFKEGK